MKTHADKKKFVITGCDLLFVQYLYVIILNLSKTIVAATTTGQKRVLCLYRHGKGHVAHNL